MNDWEPTVATPDDGFFPGWWLVALVGLIMVVTTGLIGFAFSSWGLAMKDDFDVGVGDAAAAIAALSLLGWVLGPVAGYLGDRVISIRKLVISGLVILAGAYIFLSQLQNPWMALAVAVLMAAGAAMCGWVLLMAVLCRWFVRRRTLAIALANMAVPLGSILLIPLIFFVSDFDFVGWRTTVFALAVFILLVALAAFAWLRNRPEDRGLLPYGASATKPQPRFSELETLRTRAFWLIALGDGLAAIEIEKTLGSEDATAERVIASALIGIVSLPSMLLAGLLGDRFSKTSLLALFAAFQVVGLVLFAFFDTPAASYFCAAALAIGEGGRTPLRVSILADYFGTDSLATILGMFGFFAGLMGFVGGLLYWPLYEFIEDDRVLLILAGLALMAAYCFLKARAPQLPPESVPDKQLEGY